MPTYRLNKVGPDTEVTISATIDGEVKGRTMRWVAFCFQFIGAKNASTIIALRQRLESHGEGEWQHPDGGMMVTVKVTGE